MFCNKPFLRIKNPTDAKTIVRRRQKSGDTFTINPGTWGKENPRNRVRHTSRHSLLRAREGQNQPYSMRKALNIL
jgi:hypothetical protein